MKEAVNKRRLTAIAAAAAVILAIAGAMAYFSYANGGDGNEHVKAEIVETGIIPDGGADNGTLKRDILPGTSEQRDLTVRLDADTDAFVFLIVKDTVNTNDADLVTYAIDPGWNVLDKTDLGTMTIQKFKDFFNDKAEGTLTLAPQDTNTKIYYRVEHGTALSHSFTYPVLKDNQISYSSALTNDDVKNIQDDNAISFQTYAIQMQPFNDPVKAWNQEEEVGISLNKNTLTLKVDQDETLLATVTPESAAERGVTWTSSDANVATVDEVGKVTAVAPGTATITATSVADNTKTAVCEVTVEGIKYAVQIYSLDPEKSEISFGPAIGTNYVTSSKASCGSTHCIHNDTWAIIANNIKSGHADYYNSCKENRCTATVYLDATKSSVFVNGAEEMVAEGDGVGVLFDELSPDYRQWNSVRYEDDGFDGDYANSDVYRMLNTELIKSFPETLQYEIEEKEFSYTINNSEMEGSGKLWLLNFTDIVGAGISPGEEYHPDMIGYSYNGGTGTGKYWWLRDSLYDEDSGVVTVPHRWKATYISYNGSYETAKVNRTDHGIAPGFSIAKAN